jgi:hypothetical protein
VNVLFHCVVSAFTCTVASGFFCFAAFSAPPLPELPGCLAETMKQSESRCAIALMWRVTNECLQTDVSEPIPSLSPKELTRNGPKSS